MSLWFNDATAREYTTRHQALERMRLFSILFAPPGLPEIAIVGSVVAQNPGVVFAKSNVITGFSVELLDRLGAFSDPRKWGEIEAQIKKYKENGGIRKRKKEYQKILKIPLTLPHHHPCPAHPPHPARSPPALIKRYLKNGEERLNRGNFFFLMKTISLSVLF